MIHERNGFSEANLISEDEFGSVYKGIIDHDDRFFAVTFFHYQNGASNKRFIVECEAWRNIQHRNLLKVFMFKCYFKAMIKALVYTFMPNGSLHDWLHSHASKSMLKLSQRINIFIDANHCLPTIFHYDMKPNNILMDDDNMVCI